MAKIGYARVSTADQNPDLQTDALKRAGCRVIFTEHKSGKTLDRPELKACLERLKAGDVLIVWKLDRLGRSLSHLIQTVADLQARGVGFKCIAESIDTTSASGKLVFHLMGALAEFERSLNSERTRAGLAAAKRRGIKPGPKGKLSHIQIQDAKARIDKGDTASHVARVLKVDRSTLWRALSRASE